MKIFSCVIIFSTFSSLSFKGICQNLVPNPSFEDVLFCPNGLGQVYLANSWATYGYSPDIFCACSPIGLNVPFNVRSFQFANSGSCMVGLITYRRQNGPTGPNTREFVGTELIQPLSIGQKYYFSCYINFAYGAATNIASNNFGLKLLNYPADSTQPTSLITNTTIIFSDSAITDTLAWYKVSGNFIADSAYKNIALGNFLFDNLTDTISFGTFPPEISYYFLDDICLSTDSLYCENWTSNQEIHDGVSKLILYPNPVLSNLNITAKMGIKSMTVKNVIGRQVLYYEGITDTSTILNIEELPSGIYLVEIDLGDSILKRKIIKL